MEDFRDGFPFVGNRLWLDLVNTTPRLGGGEPHDLLAKTDASERWAHVAGLSIAESSDNLAGLREILRPLVDRLRNGENLPPIAVEALNAALAPAARRYTLAQESGAPRLEAWFDASATAVVAHDFAEFICDFAPERLKHCDNSACNMVFYDDGKNGRRRWCSMAVCGNRDKVSRYRARKGQAL